jgi:hypothetical protein
MRISLQSETDTQDLFKQIEILTNAAKVKISSISFDDSNKVITIPMVRKHYKRKKGLLVERNKLSSSKLTESELIIGDFINYKVNDTLHLSDITILFGVKINNKEIYLSSVEEKSGKTAFDLFIKVNSYDLEFIDKE